MLDMRPLGNGSFRQLPYFACTLGCSVFCSYVSRVNPMLYINRTILADIPSTPPFKTNQYSSPPTVTPNLQIKLLLSTLQGIVKLPARSPRMNQSSRDEILLDPPYPISLDGPLQLSHCRLHQSAPYIAHNASSKARTSRTSRITSKTLRVRLKIALRPIGSRERAYSARHTESSQGSQIRNKLL